MADQYDRMTTAQLEKAAELRDPPVDLSSASNNSERADLLRQADAAEPEVEDLTAGVDAGSETTPSESQAAAGGQDTPAGPVEDGEGLLEPPEDQAEEAPTPAPAHVLEVEASLERGFFGHNPDPTPNEEYTFAAQAAKLETLDPSMVPAQEEVASDADDDSAAEQDGE